MAGRKGSEKAQGVGGKNHKVRKEVKPKEDNLQGSL